MESCVNTKRNTFLFLEGRHQQSLKQQKWSLKKTTGCHLVYHTLPRKNQLYSHNSKQMVVQPVLKKIQWWFSDIQLAFLHERNFLWNLLPLQIKIQTWWFLQGGKSSTDKLLVLTYSLKNFFYKVRSLCIQTTGLKTAIFLVSIFYVLQWWKSGILTEAEEVIKNSFSPWLFWCSCFTHFPLFRNLTVLLQSYRDTSHVKVTILC